MRREDHRGGFRIRKGVQSGPDFLGYCLQIAWKGEPALDEIEGDATSRLGERLLDPELVAAGADARVVRREHYANHLVHAGLL